MIRKTISSYIWQLLDEDQQLSVKQMCSQYASDHTFDYEFSYYKILFTDENLLLATLKDPAAMGYLN